MTDLASVPRLLWPLVPPRDPDYAAAAVLHDFSYEWKQGLFTRVVADAIFYQAMRVPGVATWRAVMMYLAVRLPDNWTVHKPDSADIATRRTEGISPGMR